MVKKKIKSSQKTRRRENYQLEDVPVNTGLPPQVEGQLRCFCRLSVTQITWDVPNTPEVTYVSFKWWGEPGNGIVFRPVDPKHGGGEQAKTTARYPVRSGPKQFAAYLADMSSLVLDVLSGAMQVPIGTVEVPNISQLAPNKPINGLYPIVSPTEEKIGELHVSVVLESLMASYDSTGSIPTTDVSMETSHVTQESTYPKQSRPTPHTDQPRKPVEDPFISPASHQNVETRFQNGHADDLRQHLHYEADPVEQRYKQIDDGSAIAITTNGDIIRTNCGESMQSGRKTVGVEGASQRQADGDLLSVLLDRGNKLREQMIISSLESKSKGGNQLVQQQQRGPHFNHLEQKQVDMSIRSSDGSFLHEILKSEKLYGGGEDVDLENAAVDLVFGDQLTDELRMFGRGSPTGSISGDDDILSDREDPVHSESILNELFYKNPASDNELSGSEEKRKKKSHANLDDEANMRPPSRSSSVSSLNLAFPPDIKPKKASKSKTPPRTPKRKSRVKTVRKGSKKRKSSRSRSRASEGSESDALSTASTPRSESSRVSFDMVPSDIDEPMDREETRHRKVEKVDGLSVERLTLLGRVHVARVTVDQLLLSDNNLDTSTSKPKSKTKYGIKPPRPSPKAKKSCTYFIEYQFPVVATSRDKYSPNAMATEVMRVVSRNVKNGVVTFNHRSVFPVMFDGTAVEKWWKSALVFKLYSRTAGQKVPKLLGSCGIPLKSILKSESLHVGKNLEIRQSDNGRNTSMNGSRVMADGNLGDLKIIVELASDSKEFPTQLARTKLAEMTGKAKVVPIAQTPAPPAQPPPPAQYLQQIHKPPVPPVVQDSEPQRGFPQGIEKRSRSRSRSPGHKVQNRGAVHADGLSAPLPVSVQHFDGDQVVLNYPHLQQQQQEGEVMTLHALLMIPDGKGITMQGIPSLMAAKRHPVFQPPSALTAPGVRARDMCVRNCYLVCKMFWCDEAVHSAVCWGTSEPQFKFQQVAPVLMSQSLLERLKNNFMIVEVWDKKTSADNDKLVGIVKLSLHQFYMSFRDKRISSALLKSQYPVIAVENAQPVVDVFSGSQFGSLNVLLAMGSAEQIAHLVRMKSDGMSVVSGPERPQHYLERQDLLHQGDTVPAQIGTESVVEHVFEVVIEGVRGLSLFENMIWGEADCFVQYHFPAQQQSHTPGAPVIRHAVPTMKAFRTATTLCVADPTFHDVTRHRVLLPQGTPVQRELLTACANSGSGGGGIPFELWCRFYHPNVRDQCIAKASLPLAKLCAMITMQKRGEPSVQSFSFPLTHVPTDQSTDDHKSRDGGLIDITMHYKSQTMQSETGTAAAQKNLTGAQVCISVGVVRASGLKAAAESAAYMDQGMQYPAEVGVNTYVRVKLSFLGADGERITRTVARSFCPEFSHFMDFPCPLLWTEANSDALCLAEMLETAEAAFEVWHQVPGMSSDLDRQLNALTTDGVSGRQIVEKTSDVLLGSTTLPLVNLLSQRTGISGWYPVNIPVSAWDQDKVGEDQEPSGEGSRSTQGAGLHRVGGGIELSVKFAHHDDRERVIHAARGVGWSPVNLDVEQDDWESEDEDTNRYHHVNITIDHVNFPLQNALIAGQNTLDKTAKCYVRYKFYDKAAVMTKFSPVSVNSSGYIVSQPRNRHDLQLPDSSMFKWYLREERLEVQVWVTYGHHGDDRQRPKHRDKLIGTAYISMETLSDQRRKQHRISGMFPLYKPGACNLGGGYIRAHITVKPQFGRNEQSECQEGLITLDGEDIDVDYDPDDSFHQIVSHKPSQKSPKKASPQAGEVTMMQEEESSDSRETNNTFTVIVQVERALHLPQMHDKQKNTYYMPNTYVSYPTSESTIPSYTIVFHNSDNPVWDHEHETKLSAEMLQQENKHLVFKVWHKPDGAPKSPDKLTDRVLGFVSVDLTPLSSGLQQISGWYNIMDFNGQIKGQIKINVIPQESVISGESVPSPQLADLSVYPPSAQFLSLPLVGIQGMTSDSGPLSLPAHNQSHFRQHYEQVKQHHELLQHQLQQHIQQFLRQQDECRQSEPPLSLPSDVTQVTQGIKTSIPSVPTDLSPQEPSLYQREVSVHWRPNIPELRHEESSSRSYLFTSLRKQMQDLDDITFNLRMKLTCKPTNTDPLQSELNRLPDFEIPVSLQHPLTSTQSSLTLSNFPRSQNDTPRDDLAYTGSHGAESSRTAGDSGAFSAEQSAADKYEDSAPTSQRSCSDRIDTLRSGVTPRDFLDSGIINTNNNSNIEEPEPNIWLTMTPRENEKKDEYSESGGFNYRHSPREVVNTPREIRNCSNELEQLLNINKTDTDSDKLGKKVSTAEEVVSKSEQKQMSIIQEYSENDKSDSEDEEGENRYYHRYRDLLDNEEDNEADDDDVEEDEDEGEVIVPRRINDVSGKFSPTGEIIMLSDDISNSVPFDFASRPSHKDDVEQFEDVYHKPSSLSNSVKSDRPESGKSRSEKSENSVQENVDILQDIESDEDSESRYEDAVEISRKEPVIFDEKDSWLSDSDREPEREEHVVGYQYLHNQRQLGKPNHHRQDSDTGYSSRDNVSESYLTPSAGGTNSETDISRLHEHWDHRDSDEHVFSDRPKNRLLANVELESTGGSFGLKSDRGHFRLSSAGSRNTHKSSEPSVSESFDEKEEQNYIRHGLDPIESARESQPVSARSDELENFFSHKHTNNNNQINSARSESDTSNYGEYNDNVVNGGVSEGNNDSDSNEGSGSRKVTPRYTERDPVPNFFMPVQHLEESLRTLQIATNKADPVKESEKAVAASEMVSKLTTKDKFAQINTKSRLPTAEETKRIAKIFSSKFS